MSLSVGNQLGPFEILSPLGAGGMGEVYRARDTRLDRQVAIKVLPERLTRSVEFKQRFEREAKSISQLSHPHICTLHDVGHQDGLDYLVMELLEGETLTQRLSKGPLPLDQVLRHGIEIASALDAAHRKGVVHRDLKPGNIMLTKTGAKLLDFGLAKSAAILDSDPGAVTVTQPLTSTGAILGTFQYMAPEQLEGTEADARTDIFAFGAVLYEMLTGNRAFEGGSRASLIASIMTAQPQSISALQPMAPPALDRLVRKCLAKDRDARWQSAADCTDELRWIAESGSQVGTLSPDSSRRPRREAFAWLLVLTSWVVAAVITAAAVQRSKTDLRAFRAVIPSPKDTTFISVGYGPREGGPVSISPDGRILTFLAKDAAGREQLWIQSLDSLTARPLPGTGNAIYPFWSPDSKTIGFFANGKLKRIDAAGGPPFTVCDANSGRGGTWNADGQIVFAPAPTGPLHRVSAAGGRSSPVSTFDDAAHEETHRWPFFLPDGRHFLYFVRFKGGTTAKERNSIWIASLDGTIRQRVLSSRSNAAYASGHILFAHEGALMARPFDSKRLEFTGDAFPVAHEIQFDEAYSHAVFSASTNGVLVYHTGSTGERTQLVWMDRSGSELATVGDRAEYFAPRISPDGRLAAVVIDHVQNSPQADIWLIDLLRGSRARFTFDAGYDVSPVWSPDGNYLAFASDRIGPFDLYRKSVGGFGDEELMIETNQDNFPTAWSPDGKHIFYEARPAAFGRTTQTASEIWILSLDGERKPIPFLETSFGASYPVASPDGRWMAYQSNETGRDEIYVTPFPGPGRKWQVSTEGGTQPKWRDDGKELFYISSDSKLMAVDVRPGGSTFEIGQISPLFEIMTSAGGAPYDPAADGERFLVVKDVTAQTASFLTLVVNWTVEFDSK